MTQQPSTFTFLCKHSSHLHIPLHIAHKQMGISGYPRLIRATKTFGVSSRALLANMLSCTPGCAPISPTAADKASVMLQVRQVSSGLIHCCRNCHCHCPHLHPHLLSRSHSRVVHMYMHMHTATHGTLRLERRYRRGIETGYTPFPYRTRINAHAPISTHASKH